ncbi:hypothetical protein C9374_002319 [Naegleria lovaniensis]|uniref:RING-type domain-containing protein n=1 Tax=Naegleria lovaniensis TaxID=51637 RepID=A0AA88KK97_NAELO|nr:uncharacterized protein C9374_002319 [Naegleria lovaniensis]KAG2386575.1 hypothetical protein C9374_002319 [Naegleria lovaniensis]
MFSQFLHSLSSSVASSMDESGSSSRIAETRHQDGQHHAEELRSDDETNHTRNISRDNNQQQSVPSSSETRQHHHHDQFRNLLFGGARRGGHGLLIEDDDEDEDDEQRSPVVASSSSTSHIHQRDNTTTAEETTASSSDNANNPVANTNDTENISTTAAAHSRDDLFHTAAARLALGNRLYRLRARARRNRSRNFSEINGFHIANGSKTPFWKSGLVNSMYTTYYLFLQIALILFKLESRFMFNAPAWVFGWVLVIIPTYVMSLIFLVSLAFWGVKDLIKWRRHYSRQYRRFERYASQLDEASRAVATFRNTDPLRYSSVRSIQREKRKAVDRFVGYSVFAGIIVGLVCAILICIKLDYIDQFALPFTSIFSVIMVYSVLQCIAAYIYLGVIHGAAKNKLQVLLEMFGVVLCVVCFLILLGVRLDKYVYYMPYAFSLIPLFCLNTALLLYNIISAVRSFSLAPNPNKNNNIKEDSFMTLSGLLITMYNGMERKRKEDIGEPLHDESELSLTDVQKKQRLKNRMDAIFAAMCSIPVNVCFGLISYYGEANTIEWHHYLGIFIPLLVPIFLLCIWTTFRQKIIERYYRAHSSSTATNETEMQDTSEEPTMSVRDILNNSEAMRALRSGATNTQTNLSPLMILYLHSLIREQQEQEHTDTEHQDTGRNAALMQFLQELMEARSRPVSQGLTREYLATLPTHIYKQQEGVQLNTTCPICLCDYEDGDELRTLPCFHIFHKECIDNWLLQKKICAICKHEVDSYNEQSFYYQDEDNV